MTHTDSLRGRPALSAFLESDTNDGYDLIVSTNRDRDVCVWVHASSMEFLIHGFTTTEAAHVWINAHRGAHWLHNAPFRRLEWATELWAHLLWDTVAAQLGSAPMDARLAVVRSLQDSLTTVGGVIGDNTMHGQNGTHIGDVFHSDRTTHNNTANVNTSPFAA